MRIVLTGATSFIGRAVLKELLAGGHQVFAVVRPGSPGREELERAAQPTASLKILPCPLSDIHTLVAHPALAGGADAWMHLGWRF